MLFKDSRKQAVVDHQEYGANPFSDSQPLRGSATAAETGQNDFGSNYVSSPLEATTAVQTGQHDTSSSEQTSTAVATMAEGVPQAAQREAVIIPSTGVKSAGTMRPPKGRRVVIHAASAIALVLVVLGVLTAVVPVDTHGQSGPFGLFKPSTKMSVTQQQKTALITSQIATATAVTQDGYDAGNQSYAYVNTAITPAPTQAPVTPSTSVSGDPVNAAADGTFTDNFTAGQCTYWADEREYALTGYAVPWSGNADEWPYNAPSYGWEVSQTPILHSIIALEPGVQGAGSYGHVAIVESINSDGSLTTSNWNWNGSWGETTYVTFYPGSGVYFIYP
ncbi:MAG TPA: CHAP domain-containing protein [Dictyobacter sp.]|jgi:surface antigen|nr:CHAP domain-containing protein [Dictyobacter sp.]